VGRGDRWKRVVDVVGALVALVALSPVLALLAFRIRHELGAPVLFRQQRPGLHGEIFTLYKFRTMTDERDAEGDLLPDDERLTDFGRFLRSTSLDELPELWNVLRGDMSLVGPRPLLVEYLELYSPEQARRHEVRPGLTGWSQVNGRNDMPWPDKLALDVWYVDHRSGWVDLPIILRTLLVVATRRGVTFQGEATTVRFAGEAAASGRDDGAPGRGSTSPQDRQSPPGAS
jgi:sugar transferase EpsL